MTGFAVENDHILPPAGHMPQSQVASNVVMTEKNVVKKLEHLFQTITDIFFFFKG